MIWLRKKQKDNFIIGLDKQQISEFMSLKMISFEDYYKSIQSKNLSEEQMEDIYSYLYQLMDVYVHCRILYRWIQVGTKKNRIKLIKVLKRIDNLEKLCAINQIFSQNKINEIDIDIQDLLNKDLTEVCKNNATIINLMYLKSVFDLLSSVKYNRYFERMNIYFQDQFCLYLRIFPKFLENSILEVYKISDSYYPIYNFLGNELFDMTADFKVIKDSVKICSQFL